MKLPSKEHQLFWNDILVSAIAFNTIKIIEVQKLAKWKNKNI